MMDKNNISKNAISNTALVKMLGLFIKHHRLEQNKSQEQLANEAGINRTTLVEFEKGTRSNIITFIQLLRALSLLNVMDQFEIKQQISPIQLAKMEQLKRKRASKTKLTTKRTKSDW